MRVKLPLCPKLAQLSYTPPSTTAVVNKYLTDAVQGKDITLTPLSPFAVELRGEQHDVESITRNYGFFLCAFDPKQIPNVDAVYQQCMANAATWTTIVQSDKPDELMLSNTHYVGVCVP